MVNILFLRLLPVHKYLFRVKKGATRLSRCSWLEPSVDYTILLSELSDGGTENFTSRVCGWGEMMADKFKLVFKINTGTVVLGLGYIIGLKYAAIICAGSLAVWLIIVPGFSLLWGDQVLNAWNPDIVTAVKDMSPESYL